MSSAPSQDIVTEFSYLLLYVTLIEDIFGTCSFHTLGRVCLGGFFADFYTRLFRRALLRTPTQAGWRRSSELGQWSDGGGQALAEVVVCAVGLSFYPL